MHSQEIKPTQDLDRTCAIAIANELWPTFTDQEKTLVRFGMFPARKMELAEAALCAAGVAPRDAGRLLSVALMDCANRNGGMIA